MTHSPTTSWRRLPSCRLAQGFRLLDQALRTDIRAVPEAPRALHALFADLERVPSWVDWPRLDRGGAVVLRAGAAAGIVLGMKSLILGYASPGGNKPLVFSGRLQEQASRRLAETCRFVQAVSRPRGMYRHGEGFAITLKVRLMHAQVRRLIQRSGRWQPESWGHPVNQHDMLATVILFSAALIEGLRQLGYGVTPEEAEDVIHLWRYAGRVIGVEDALLPRSFSEAMAGRAPDPREPGRARRRRPGAGAGAVRCPAGGASRPGRHREPLDGRAPDRGHARGLPPPDRGSQPPTPWASAARRWARWPAWCARRPGWPRT